MAWTFVGVSNVVEVTTTSHALVTTGISGLQQGDLLIACISSRIGSTSAVTLPTGGEWTLINQQLNNSTVTTSSAQASATMAYCIRGASNPNLTFTHPVAPSVAIGHIVAYRGQKYASPLDVVTAATTATAVTAISVGGFTTTTANELIVAMIAGGQEANHTVFDATDPGTDSGTNANQTANPIVGTWQERVDSNTTTGADVSLGIYDAVKSTAGATGNFTATASISSGHSVVAGSFKIEPAAPFGIHATARLASASSSGVNFSCPAITVPSTLLIGVLSGDGGPSFGVSDNGGGAISAWTKLASAGTSTNFLEVWYATAANTISAGTINFDGAQTSASNLALDIVIISGANILGPFDGSAVTGTTDPLSITTTFASDLIVGAYHFASTANPTQGSGWTKISGADSQLVEYDIKQATQSGLSVTVGTGVGNANRGIAFAIKEGAQGSTVAYPAYATFAGAGGLTADLTKLPIAIAATFAGAGGLTANPIPVKTGTATFAGAGGLISTGIVQRAASATLAGAGSLTADATQVTGGGTSHSGSATFAGAGGLTANAYRVSSSGDLCNDGTAFAGNDQDAARNPSAAFDNSNSSDYQSTFIPGQVDVWIDNQLAGGAATVVSYTLISGDDNDNRDPKNWVLQGSNNGSTWVVLDSQIGELFTARIQSKTYDFSNSTAYSYYRFYVTDIRNSWDPAVFPSQRFQIQEIQLWTGAGGTGTNVGIGGTCTGSSENAASSQQFGKAYDNSTATKWLALNINPSSGPNRWYIGYRHATAQAINQYTITSSAGAGSDTMDPQDWKFQGSNDSYTWIDQDTRTGEDFPSRSQKKTYSFTNTAGACRWWRLLVSKRGDNGTTGAFQIAEMEMLVGAVGTAYSGSATFTGAGGLTANATVVPPYDTDLCRSGVAWSHTARTGIEGCDKAFDNNFTTSKWNSAAAAHTFDVWVVITPSGGPYTAVSYTVTSASSNTDPRPANWAFEGSNDGTNWVLLDSQIAVTFSGFSVTNTYNFANSTPYAYYRFYFTACNKEWSVVDTASFEVGELGVWTGSSGTGTNVALASSGATYTKSDDAGTDVIGNAFDNSTATRWRADNLNPNAGPDGWWIGYRLPSAAAINKYTITSGNDASDRDPKDWKFQGSDDGAIWTDQDTRSAYTFPNRNETHTFTFTNTIGAKRFWRLFVTARQGGGQSLVQLNELEMMAVPVRTVGRITRLGYSGFGVRRAGSFARVPSGTSHAGSATLAGTGGLVANPFVGKFATATLAGTGGLIASPTQIMQASATLAGAGGLSANPFVGKFATATLAGAGNLIASPTQIMQASATFAGIGSIAADLTTPAAQTYPITATFAGTGSFAADAFPAKFATATFAGVGGLTAQATQVLAATATLAGAGGLSASAFLAKFATATLTGSGGLTAQATQLMAASAAFAGAGGLTTDPFVGKPVTATLAGTGGLIATTSITSPLMATFAGAGGLIAQPTQRMAVSVTFAGAGGLIAAPAQVTQTSALLAGAGSFLATLTASGIVPVNATLAGTGGLTASVSAQLMAATATFAGSGSLTANSFPAKFATATLAGAGGLTAALTQLMQVTATLAGAGGLAANGVVTKPATAALAGAGGLTAAPTQLMQASAMLAGAGGISASLTASGIVAGNATFAGVGGLTANTFVAKFATATFAGSGSLIAQPTQLMVVGATLAGTGGIAADLTPPAAQTYQITATLAGAGGLAANGVVVKPLQATLAGTGGFIADGQVFKPLTATLAGAGGLTSTPSLMMATSAALAGAGSFSANAFPAKFASATLAGAGGLTAAVSSTLLPASAALAGSGGLTAAPSQLMSASATLSGAGSLTTAEAQRLAVVAAFAGAGGLVAAPSQRMTASATLAGAGGLTAESIFVGSGQQLIDALLGGTGGLFADAELVRAPIPPMAGQVEPPYFYPRPQYADIECKIETGQSQGATGRLQQDVVFMLQTNQEPRGVISDAALDIPLVAAVRQLRGDSRSAARLAMALRVDARQSAGGSALDGRLRIGVIVKSGGEAPAIPEYHGEPEFFEPTE